MLSANFRRVLQVASSATRLNQVRSVSLTLRRMDEAMEHLKGNPYYDKYASKINKVKEKHPAELVSAVQKRQAQINSEASDPMASAVGVRKISAQAEKPKKTLPKGSYGYAPEKKLESIMKTDLLKDKTPEEISYIWTEYLKTQQVISGVMKGSLYQRIRDTANKFDKFLFPLPREQGYEFILAQFAAQEIHFTPLVNFQAFGENAPECLTMVHYTEYQDNHDLVLMRGEYDSKIISSNEAQFLANQVQLYYSGQDEKKTVLLQRFHTDPSNFSHMDLVNELEQLDLSALAKKQPNK